LIFFAGLDWPRPPVGPPTNAATPRPAAFLEGVIGMNAEISVVSFCRNAFFGLAFGTGWALVQVVAKAIAWLFQQVAN
jgi:hypothetical protein